MTDQILELLGNPLLEDQNEILGDILIGEENAKEGLVVWPAGDADVNELTVFATGASGRVRKVPDALTGELKAGRTGRFDSTTTCLATRCRAEAGRSSRRGRTTMSRKRASRRPDDIGVWRNGANRSPDEGPPPDFGGRGGRRWWLISRQRPADAGGSEECTTPIEIPSPG